MLPESGDNVVSGSDVDEKEGLCNELVFMNGGGYRDRTDDLLNAIQTLSQLS